MYDAQHVDEGRAMVYLGSPGGPVDDPVWIADGGQANAHFGISVASAGDVNADGFDDLLVGASRHDAGKAAEGAAHLYLGSPAGPLPDPTWTGYGNQAGAGYGISVAGIGDVNGDGYDDAAVGASAYDNGQDDEGRVFFYLGSPAGFSETAEWTAESDQAGAAFGVSVAGAGDVDGDGFDDALVGAHHFDNDEFDEGRAYLYRGSRAGLLLGKSR